MDIAPGFGRMLSQCVAGRLSSGQSLQVYPEGRIRRSSPSLPMRIGAWFSLRNKARGRHDLASIRDAGCRDNDFDPRGPELLNLLYPPVLTRIGGCKLCARLNQA